MREQRQKTENGLLPSWPPFAEFRQSMVDLLGEAQKPIKEKLNIVEARLTDHINKTDANFKRVDASFKTAKTYLLNHVTNTNRKINDLSIKMDQLLEKIG